MLEVTLYAFERKVRTKLERKFCWYDPELKKIIEKTGGKLFYRYNKKKKKCLPEVQEVEEYILQNSWNDIIKFAENNKFNIAVKNISKGRLLVFEIDNYDWIKAQKELKELKIYFTAEEVEDAQNNS